MAAAGLNLTDIYTETNYDNKTAIEKVIEPIIDVAITTSASLVTNNPKYREKIKLIPPGKNILSNLVDNHPYFGIREIEIISTGKKIVLPRIREVLVGVNISEKQAFNIAMTLHRHWKTVRQLNAEEDSYVEFLSPDSIATKIPLPLHDGVESFYIDQDLKYSLNNYFILLYMVFGIGAVHILRIYYRRKIDELLSFHTRIEQFIRFPDIIFITKWLL